MVYKHDLIIGMFAQLISMATALAFLTLIFTRVDSIQGWAFNELLFLAGFSGFVMNLHHIFFFNIYRLGEQYIVQGKMDRILLRPLNPLFQVYADDVSDNNLSKLVANFALIVYSAVQIGLNPGLFQLFIATGFVVGGVMIYGAVFLTFATTAFWTGKSDAAIWLVFQLSDFRKYPYSIYGDAIKIILVTLIPIALMSFFPVTYILNRPGWIEWQIISLLAGPVLFLLSYKFWKKGLSNYSSTGS
jgi:ABC-2 type transport system permease protein